MTIELNANGEVKSYVIAAQQEIRKRLNVTKVKKWSMHISEFTNIFFLTGYTNSKTCTAYIHPDGTISYC